MIKDMSPRTVKVWIVPAITCLVFFSMLMYGIPYARGYGWEKEALIGMLRNLWSAPDWAHGMFVPFISLGLVLMNWRKLSQIPIRGSLWGGAVIVFGIFVYCIGLKAETEYFGYASIQILLAGVILWFWGIRVFSIVSFAWFFFLFTWPMPFLDGMLALPLRLEMSHTAHSVLGFLGTPNVQSGTAIYSAPNLATGLDTGAKFRIDIADPCSGLHSLFALMMISALAAYISLQSVVFRWLVFFAAIPLAIAGNVIRILLLVWGTETFGSSILGTDENPSAFHLGCGYAVYVVALSLLFGLINFLNSKWLAGLRQNYFGSSPSGDHALENTGAPLPSGGAI